MLHDQKITFNQIWREFLLVRPFSKTVNLIIGRNAKKVVTRIIITPFKLTKKGGEQYIVDDETCPGSWRVARTR